jgi:hypothetical protein
MEDYQEAEAGGQMISPSESRRKLSRWMRRLARRSGGTIPPLPPPLPLLLLLLPLLLQVLLRVRVLVVVLLLVVACEEVQQQQQQAGEVIVVVVVCGSLGWARRRCPECSCGRTPPPPPPLPHYRVAAWQLAMATAAARHRPQLWRTTRRRWRPRERFHSSD